jgi:hypothetical protein
MGTQTNVKFSRLATPIAETLTALQNHVFDPLQIKLRKFSRIQPTNEKEFPGYDAVGKLLKVQTVAEVLDEVGRGESFGLEYLVGVPAYLYLNFFDFTDDGYSMLLNFDSSLLYFNDAANDAGDVLERILSAIVAELDLDACGYNSSDRYEGEFNALTTGEIVAGLRSGELLQMQPPFYYALKTAHLSRKEARALASTSTARYKHPGAHHILCAWPP